MPSTCNTHSSKSTYPFNIQSEHCYWERTSTIPPPPQSLQKEKKGFYLRGFRSFMEELSTSLILPPGDSPRSTSDPAISGLEISATTCHINQYNITYLHVYVICKKNCNFKNSANTLSLSLSLMFNVCFYPEFEDAHLLTRY